MSIFNKIFNREKPQIDNSKFNTLKKTNYKTFDDLVEQNAGLSFEKQLLFGEIIGSNAWQLNMGKGLISFGDIEFPIQIIGSLAFNNNSWMWGWANTQSGMPENLLIQSNQLKEIGEKNNIEELINGHFNVEEGFEHKIGMIACGLFKSKSYYCANYGQGTLVITIDDAKIPEIDKSRLEKVMMGFPQLISTTVLNHKNTYKNYLIDRDFELNISEDKIEGLRNNKILVAEFDELSRLKSLYEEV